MFSRDDCDDGDAAVHPGATEICDGQDNDCDGLSDDDDPSVTGTLTWYADADGDGYGSSAAVASACIQPAGYVANSLDCDDTDAHITGTSTWYRDGDGDGYGDVGATTASCAQPTGYVANSTDCQDGDAGIHPGASETCDGLDEDCDGLVDDADPGVDTSTGTEWCDDLDGDGYYGDSSSIWACTAPSGAAACSAADDCDDGDNSVNPGMSEICGNGVDDNCDGSGYPVDGDGHDDLLVGAEDDGTAASGAGAAFLFYGGSW